MGAIWAAAWAAVGALINVADRGNSIDRFWLGPAIGMWPGFVSGVIFSVLLGIVTIGGGTSGLSLKTSVICGGAAGLIVGVLPFVINKPPGEAPLWLAGLVVVGSMTLLGAVLAAGSLPLVRRATR